VRDSRLRGMRIRLKMWKVVMKARHMAQAVI